MRISDVPHIPPELRNEAEHVSQVRTDPEEKRGRDVRPRQPRGRRAARRRGPRARGAARLATIHVEIPGAGELQLEHVLLDVSGPLASRGVSAAGSSSACMRWRRGLLCDPSPRTRTARSGRSWRPSGSSPSASGRGREGGGGESPGRGSARGGRKTARTTRRCWSWRRSGSPASARRALPGRRSGKPTPCASQPSTRSTSCSTSARSWPLYGHRSTGAEWGWCSRGDCDRGVAETLAPPLGEGSVTGCVRASLVAAADMAE